MMKAEPGRTPRRTFLRRFMDAGLMDSATEIGRLSRLLADRTLLVSLQLLFGFARWHAHSPDSSRPYRKQLAALINGLNPACVVEVGCGLGGIIARVRAARRFGLDIDPAVIRAARLLHGRSVRFIVGSFDEVPNENIDVLIAVNWIHDFSPAQAEEWIASQLSRVRYILVDAIKAGTPGYRYNHRFDFLKTCGTLESIAAAAEPHRQFLLWKLHTGSDGLRLANASVVQLPQ